MPRGCDRVDGHVDTSAFSPAPQRVLARGAGHAATGSEAGAANASLSAYAALDETTCLVLGPSLLNELCKPPSAGVAAGSDEWEEEVGPLLDGLLRDKFRLAGARLVHLTDAQATTWARAREHALQARWGRRRPSDIGTQTANVDVVKAELTSGASLVLALYRSNAVAHLYRKTCPGANAAVGLAPFVVGIVCAGFSPPGRLREMSDGRTKRRSVRIPLRHGRSERSRVLLPMPSGGPRRRGSFDGARRCSAGNGESDLCRHPDHR